MHKNLSLKQKIHWDYGRMDFFCSKHHPIYLYGAGKAAEIVADYIYALGYKVEAFIVTSNDSLLQEFRGRPVYAADDVTLHVGAGIILATGFEHRHKIMEELEKRNWLEYTFVQSLCYQGDLSENLVPLPCKKNIMSGLNGFFANFTELECIGECYQTDKVKAYHDYLRKYEYFLKPFKNKVFTLLELGVFKGGSIRMWGEYFQQAQVVGVDIDESCLNVRGANRSIVIGDLGDEQVLRELCDLKPSIIVDDASHIWSHQIMALFTLFEVLPSGGLYILEDISTSFPCKGYKNYADMNVSAYEICSAVAECVTSGGCLTDRATINRVGVLLGEVEKMAAQVEVVSLMCGSCIFIKR